MNAQSNPSPRIPDIITEQAAAEVLAKAEEITSRSREFVTSNAPAYPADLVDEEINAALMAAEIFEYLDVLTGNLTRVELKGVDYVRKLRDYAQQLQAYHLQFAEELSED